MEQLGNISPETFIKVGGLIAAGVLGFVVGCASAPAALVSDGIGLAVTHNELPLLKQNFLNSPDWQFAIYAYAAGTIAGMTIRAIHDRRHEPKSRKTKDTYSD